MNDVFISYAHIDDQPLTEGQRGWVSQFHRTLEVRLGQLLGEEPKIWRDPKLTGNDCFDQAITTQFNEVKALISVLSPRYAKSEWCTRELQEFCRAAERTGGIQVRNKSRIFKVVKTPVLPQELPPALAGLFQHLLGFEFFSIDRDTGRLREFIEDFGPEAKRSYLEKIYDLAYEICQLLKSFQPGSVHAPAAQPCGKVVYLAETTTDLQAERDQIKRELQERGHAVLPDRPLPQVQSDLETLIREHLQRSQMAVQLIGGRYGFIPEGGAESVVALQHRLATERCHQGQFSRLIWLPPGLVPAEARQQLLIETLQQDSAGMISTELLQGSLEQLKSLVVKKISARAEPPAPVLPAEAGMKLVYLVCDQSDLSAIAPLEDYLYDCGFEVKTPHFEGNEDQFVQVHLENLKFCDGVIIYYGNASGPWLDMKLMDILKTPGYGRTKPLHAKAVYVAPPETPHKQRFKTRVASILRAQPVFSPEVVQPFLEKLGVTGP